MVLKEQVYIFLLFIFIFQFEAKGSEEHIIIDNFTYQYNPALKLSYLIDSSKNLKIHDILNQKYQERFLRNEKEVPHFGLRKASLWYRFDIENRTSTDLFLEIDNPILDTVEYFLVNNDGQLVHHYLTGNHVKIKEREVKTSQLLIDLKLSESSRHTCYLKIKSMASSFMTPMEIASMKTLFEIDHTKDLWQGLYFGLIAFIFIYNVFLFISIKDRSYIYFALFIAAMGWLFALLRGFGFQYIWSDYPYLNMLTPFVGSVAGFYAILFSCNFLKTSENTPISHRWLMGLLGFYVVVGILNVLGFHLISMRLLEFNSAMVFFFLLISAIVTWREGFIPAKYYLMSWSIFVLGFCVYVMRELGIVNTNQFTENILQLTSTATILFMSFAISKKINIYIKVKNAAQEIAIKTALENEKLISNQNLLLEAKVNQRTIDLEESITTLSKQREDLHEANNFKDKVFSIISHDLKSPIATLAGMLNVMKLQSLSELERANVVDKLEIALKNTKILLDNILAWAIRDQKQDKEAVEIELHNCVMEILDLFQYQAQDKQIEMVNNCPKGFHIHAHKSMLQLVLRNLISNALKFTPKNGEITVSIKEGMRHLLIDVSDSGVGMSKEIVAKLFKENNHTTTLGTENEKGTGLGLKLCKEFVDKYNGELSVKSKVGHGTTFTLKLKDAVPVLESVFN